MSVRRITTGTAAFTFALVRLSDCVFGPSLLPWPFYVVLFAAGILVVIWPSLECK